MTAPKLSVIIPTYNRASHLTGTLDSVFDSASCDLEVIVVDDGSTDESETVVEAYKWPVKYIRQENAGPASARNTGFSASVGRYVAFLDSDDHWIPGAISRLVELLDRRADLNLVFGDASMGTPEDGYVSVEATFGGKAFSELPAQEIERGVRKLERRAFFRLLARRNAVFLGSLILRREVVEQSGGFVPDLFGSEDWEFVMRLATSHEYAYVQETPVAYYLQHPGGISRNVDRMEREFAKAIRRISTLPELEKSDRRWVLDQLKRHDFGYAYRAYDQGNLPAARERFAHCLASRPDFKSFVFWMVSHLPLDILRATRRLKRGVLG